jgi:hypothetical protein
LPDAGYSPFSVCIATAAPGVFSVQEILGLTPDMMQSAQLTGSYLLKPETVVVSELSDIKGFEFGLVVIVGLEGESFLTPDRQKASVGATLCGCMLP